MTERFFVQGSGFMNGWFCPVRTVVSEDRGRAAAGSDSGIGNREVAKCWLIVQAYDSLRVTRASGFDPILRREHDARADWLLALTTSAGTCGGPLPKDADAIYQLRDRRRQMRNAVIVAKKLGWLGSAWAVKAVGGVRGNRGGRREG